MYKLAPPVQHASPTTHPTPIGNVVPVCAVEGVDFVTRL